MDIIVLQSQNLLGWTFEKGPGLVATGALFFAVYLLTHWVIDRSLKAWAKMRSIDRAHDARMQTWHQLMVDALRIGFGFSALMALLPQVGINPAALAAGSVGLAAVFAIAFQKSLNDTGAGLIIFFEDHFRVGEEVSIAGIKGTVERTSLRMVIVRNGEGEECVIPYGNIGTIVNHSRRAGGTETLKTEQVE